MEDFAPAIATLIPRLRRYARALCGERQRADDLVQDTLERAWERRALWLGGDLRAWLFTVMHNLHVNQIDSRSRQGIAVSAEEAAEIATRPPQESVLLMRDLASGLAALPEDQRAVLLLVGLEQMRYEEVAQVLGIPLGTVMSRLARGRERLRVLMEGQPAPLLKMVKK